MADRLPDPNKLRVGAGEVYLDRYVAGLPTGARRHIGNTEGVSSSIAVTKIEKFSSMEGARGLLDERVTSLDMTFQLVLNEIINENLQLAWMGDGATFTQSAESALLAQPINGGVAIAFDRWYDLERSTTGAKVKQVSNVVIKQGANVLVLDDDYLLKADVGMVEIKSDGTFPPTESITTWDGDAAAVSQPLTRGLTQATILAALRFVSAPDQVTGEREEVNVHKVSITPEGDLPLIGEDYAAFTLNCRVLKDVTQPAGEQFFTRRRI